MFQLTPPHATSVTKACLILHNVMRDRNPQAQNAEMDAPDGAPGAWRDVGVMAEVEAEGRGPRMNRAGKETRAYLKHYYCSPVGAVPWQEQALNAPLN